MPSAEVVREEWAKTLEKHQKDGLKYLRKFWPSMRKGDVADAFNDGLDAIEKGFLYYGTWNYEFLDFMQKWRKAADDHNIKKRARKKYDELFADFAKARKDGFKAYEKVNAKAKL